MLCPLCAGKNISRNLRLERRDVNVMFGMIMPGSTNYLIYTFITWQQRCACADRISRITTDRRSQISNSCLWLVEAVVARQSVSQSVCQSVTQQVRQPHLTDVSCCFTVAKTKVKIWRNMLVILVFKVVQLRLGKSESIHRSVSSSSLNQVLQLWSKQSIAMPRTEHIKSNQVVRWLS